MNKPEPGKNGEMNEPGSGKENCVDKDSDEKTIISEPVGSMFRNVIYETYFEPRKSPLHGLVRFICAWLGSATLFASSVLFIDFMDTYEAMTNMHRFMERPMFFMPIPLDQVAFLYFIGSIICGVLIASPKTKQGPVRLYLSGLLFSTFVVFVTSNTWGES